MIDIIKKSDTYIEVKAGPDDSVKDLAYALTRMDTLTSLEPDKCAFQTLEDNSFLFKQFYR